MKIFRYFLVVLAMSTFSQASAAENSKVLYTRMAVGEIFKIDRAERTAVISGFRYYFGNPIYSDDSEVKLIYGSGSFEMLDVGMKVRLSYAEYGVNRYVRLLEQLPFDTDIHDYATRSELLN